MALNRRNRETERLVREYARQRGLLTEADREGLVQDDARATLWERTADIRERLAAYRATGDAAEKRFFDKLSGQEAHTDLA